MFSSNNSQVANDAVFVEDIFSTTLYTGNDTSQTITNGIDLAGEGGLVWVKARTAAQSHALFDTSRGPYNFLFSNNTNEQTNYSPYGVSAFNADGFSVAGGGGYLVNGSGTTYASWTFRKQPKFFDVVTWTGNGGGDREISHNLGSAPGCIILKSTSNAGTNWFVYHRALSTPDYRYMYLQDTAAALTSGSNLWNVTSTTFRASSTLDANNNGQTYVAYLFAHNAGGFGLTGTDNVISCGSFTTDGSGYIPTVNLGYEPQWILAKPSSGTGNWFIMDNMRGWYDQQADQGNALFPNTSGAEATGYNAMIPTATGFTGPAVNFGAGITYIYIAIRRGPMKVPTSGTSVFAASTYTGDDSSNREITGLSFTPDLMINAMRAENGSGRSPAGFYWFDRLRGKGARLRSSQILAEYLVGPAYEGVNFNSYSVDAASGESNYNPALYLTHLFKRAPSFFDEVCYTGTGSTPQTIAHNLGVAPELMIIKGRSLASSSWIVYAQPIWGTGIGGFSGFDLFQLNNNGNAGGNNKQINETAPTASVFSVGYSGSTYPNTNNPSDTFVAYLFGTCAGVSKIGKYTGTGTTLQIDCGFTSGARFVLIKRADSNGDWYVWDTARGIVSGNDPYLLLNSTAAEVTSTDYIDTYSAGFEISSTAPSAINASGGTFIFLAIA